MLTLRAAFPCSRNLIICGRNTLKSSALRRIAVNTKATTAAHTSLVPQQNNRWYASQANEDLSGQSRVYYGSLAPRMKAVKIFSLITSLTGLAAQPILMEQGMKMGGTGMAVFLCGFAGFFTFVTPLLLHFITKKYVTEIYYDPANEEYTATTISIILQKIETKFRPNDVKVPEVPGMFTSFMVGGKALFVDPAFFDDPEHYVRIMGYDKPVDFKFDLTESSTPAATTETPAKETQKIKK